MGFCQTKKICFPFVRSKQTVTIQEYQAGSSACEIQRLLPDTHSFFHLLDAAADRAGRTSTLALLDLSWKRVATPFAF